MLAFFREPARAHDDRDVITGRFEGEAAVRSGDGALLGSAGGPEQRTVTGADGRFSLESPGDDVTVIVRAGGFAEKSEHVGRASSVDVVLSPAGLAETVTVTPTRTMIVTSSPGDSREKRPSAPVTVRCSGPPADSATTEAPATTAPDVSLTTPVIVPPARAARSDSTAIVMGLDYTAAPSQHP